MAVRLRLRRTGTRNKPCYRIVAADGRTKRDGRFIEIIGYYDPRHQDERVDLERADYWLSNGAQPSETVASIIKRAKEGTSFVAAPKPRPSIEDIAPAPPKEKPAKQTEEDKTENAAETTEEPKADEPKAEEPKAEAPKAEEPKAEEPKAEEPKAEEPKAEKSSTEAEDADKK